VYRGKPSVLLIAERPVGDLLRLLEERGVALKVETSLTRAAVWLEAALYDVLFVHWSERNADSLLLSNLAERWVDTPIVVSGPPADELARKALSAGASEYLPEPVSAESLAIALDSALARARSAALAVARPNVDAGLLGSSAQMRVVKETVARVASGQTTVLVRGETGTGKELIARAVHAGSARRDAPFVKVIAAALPDALLESELFGYERGAFTGANARKAGRVELAEGGTLFFDEIGELSMAMQVKLLRLIQDREYERLGGTRTYSANVRFVAATHRDLEHMVDSGAFREDLFYRLNVVSVWVPPLRARRDDIALLVNHYFEHFRVSNCKPQLQLDDAALRALVAQRWPGNVRQLVNFIERTVVLANSDRISAEDVRRGLDEQIAFLTQAGTESDTSAPDQALLEPLPVASDLQGAVPVTLAQSRVTGELHFSSAVRPLKEDMRRSEYRALTKALHSAKGNRTLAARMLGVSRRTLYTKLEEHGLL
jgi:two-component system response regulator AtoC